MEVFSPRINTDVHRSALNLLNPWLIPIPYRGPLNENVSLNLHKHRTFLTNIDGILIAKIRRVDLSPLVSTERKKRSETFEEDGIVFGDIRRDAGGH